MKKLQFTTLILMLLAGFTAEAQLYSTMSTQEIQKRLASHSPIKKGDGLKSRSLISLDSTLCNLTMPFGDDPLEATYFEYDEMNQLLKDSTFYWDVDSISGELIKYPGVKQYYTYTSAGELSSIIKLDWNRDKGIWSKDSLRLVYFYEGGRLDRISNDLYNSDSNEWYTDVFEIFLYEDDLLMGVLVGSYDDQNTFTPIARADFSYEEGLLTKEEYFFTFDGGEIWVELFYTDIEYESSNPIYTYSFFYDEEIMDYTPIESTHSIYNENDNLDIVITFLWLEEWVSFRKCTYFYSEDQVSSVTDKIRPVSELVMANPFQGGVISAPALEEQSSYTVELIDLQGKTIQTHFGFGNTWTIAAPEKPGMYLVRVRNNNQLLASRKIIATANN